MPFVDAAAVEAQMHNSVRSVSRALTQTPSLLLLKTKTASSFLDSSAWNYYTTCILGIKEFQNKANFMVYILGFGNLSFQLWKNVYTYNTMRHYRH